jgi:type IV conjugative transfer system lipoprotein TraV
MKSKLVLILLLTSASCSSSVNSEWSCPVLDGGKGHCISISDADQKIESPKLSAGNNLGYFASSQKIEINLLAPKLKDLEKLKLSKKESEETQITKETRYRTEEKVGRIWFAPRIDADGNQHSESVIQIVDEPSRWVMQR